MRAHVAATCLPATEIACSSMQASDTCRSMQVSVYVLGLLHGISRLNARRSHLDYLQRRAVDAFAKEIAKISTAPGVIAAATNISADGMTRDAARPTSANESVRESASASGHSSDASTLLDAAPSDAGVAVFHVLPESESPPRP